MSNIISRQRVLEILDSMTKGMSLNTSVKDLEERTRFFKQIHTDAALHEEYKRCLSTLGNIAALEVIDVSDQEQDLYHASLRINARKWFAERTGERE